MNDTTTNQESERDEFYRKALEADERFIREFDERASLKISWAERVGLWQICMAAFIMFSLYGMMFYLGTSR